MADEDYVSFENALRELQISADQLKRLVSEGEIRAIRGEHNTMRFRKDEIDRLKQDTGKTLQFTEATSETLSDDLLFDEADDQDVEEGASTVQLKPSAARTPPPPPPAKPAPARPAARPVSPRASPESRPVTPVRRTTSRAARGTGPVAKDPSAIGAGTMVALLLGFFVMIYATFVLLDIAEDKASGLTQGLANWAKPATASVSGG